MSDFLFLGMLATYQSGFGVVLKVKGTGQGVWLGEMKRLGYIYVRLGYIYVVAGRVCTL